MKSLNIEVWKIYINECKRISAYYTYWYELIDGMG